MRILFLGLMLVAGLAACSEEGADDQANAQSSEVQADGYSATSATPPQDLFAFGAGTQIVKSGSEDIDYGVNNGPYNLIDESSSTEWMTEADKPQVVVLELPERTALSGIAFDNGPLNIDDKAARTVRVEISDTSASGGFTTILNAELKKVEVGQSFTFPSPAIGRWVRVTVLANYGADYNAIVAIRGYGEQLTHDAKITDLSGSYLGGSGWGDVRIKQEGTRTAGCYEYLEGVLSGGSEGRVLKVEMIEQHPAGPQKLIGLFQSLSDNKRFLGLVRNQDSEPGTALYDMYIAEKLGDDIGECPQIADWSGNATRSQLSAALERDGRARLDGISFDFNSDVIRPESKFLLDQIAAILKEHPDWKITLEGHTDNVGGGLFNKDLSARRAAAVKAYLAKAGVPETRLVSAGFGFDKPVASNDTEIGRAENRRVEIVKTSK